MWLEFLEKARAIGTPTQVSIIVNGIDTTKTELHFGTAEFSKATGLSPKDASAWISKFIKWGYAKHVGSKENMQESKVKKGVMVNAKPLSIYALTEYGRTVEPLIPNRLQRLIEAVENFQQAEGDKEQSRAMAELFEVCKEVKDTKKKADVQRSRKKGGGKVEVGGESEVID